MDDCKGRQFVIPMKGAGMDKILYVSDLDGTLLRENQSISAYSCSVIGELVQNGMIFSYATARSLVTAGKVTSGLDVAIPVIVYNGAFVQNSRSKELLISNFFSQTEKHRIQNILSEYGVYPIVYSYINGCERFSYLSGHTNPGMDSFLNNRREDVRRTPVEEEDALYRGEVFYFTCIGQPDRLRPVWERLKSSGVCSCIYQRDIYSHAQWLELLPSGATKANAVLQLKKNLQCDRVITFGDGKNDISMFEISDECYAMENAVPELKAIATGIIESNERDGVARWLRENVK